MWLTTRRNRKNGKEKEENEKGHGDWSEKESCFIKARFGPPFVRPSLGIV